MELLLCFGVFWHMAQDRLLQKKIRACSQKKPEERAVPMTKGDLTRRMTEASRSMQLWNPSSWWFVRSLQEAKSNAGRVEQMRSLCEGGIAVAVKRMPNAWMGNCPEEFKQNHPDVSEQPWTDIGILMHLNRIRFPYACRFHGIFHDERITYVVTSLASDGDLFSWSDELPLLPGKQREAEVHPLAVQVFAAVRWLHSLGIAHRDLSLENILLTSGRKGKGQLEVRIIDFGMATLDRHCSEPTGKASYMAPEMHTGLYDAFLTDSFALGVVLYAMNAASYPWESTEPENCVLHQYAAKNGLRKLLATRRVSTSCKDKILDVMSPALLELLEGLLEVSPAKRIALGESCYVKQGRINALQSAWLGEEGGCGGEKPLPLSGALQKWLCN